VAPTNLLERSEVSREEDAVAVAVTTAQPEMTLQGHLRQHFSKVTWDDPKRTEVMTFGKKEDIRSIMASRDYNPLGKKLAEHQVEKLMEFIRGLAAKEREQMLNEGKLSKPAFVRAVERGQYEVIVRGRPEAMGSFAANVAQGSRDERLESVLEGLSARLGTRMEDWATSIVSTSHPDGVLRTIVVYITKHDEPQLFDVRNGLARHQREVYEAYKGFFAGL
jgi:AcrR family transcriptional regulator